MVKTSLVTGGSERIAMCFCTYNILSGYKIGYSSTGSIKIGMCRYWCNARREIYIYIYTDMYILRYYTVWYRTVLYFICCMVPYGIILYIYIYTIWYRTVLCILIRYCTVRYYADIRILACTVVLYIYNSIKQS